MYMHHKTGAWLLLSDYLQKPVCEIHHVAWFKYAEQAVMLCTKRHQSQERTIVIQMRCLLIVTKGSTGVMRQHLLRVYLHSPSIATSVFPPQTKRISLVSVVLVVTYRNLLARCLWRCQYRARHVRRWK